MAESAASTSFSSGGFVDVVVANFEIGEGEVGFHVGSFEIVKLDGIRIISAFADRPDRPFIVVKRPTVRRRDSLVPETACSKKSVRVLPVQWAFRIFVE